MRCLTCALLALMLSGCLSNVDRTREGTLGKFSEAEIKQQLQPGKSTKRDVLLLLGRPNSPEDYNGGGQWLYLSTKTDRAIYLVIPVNGDATSSLMLTFNPQNVLTDLRYTRH